MKNIFREAEKGTGPRRTIRNKWQDGRMELMHLYQMPFWLVVLPSFSSYTSLREP